MHKKYNLSDIAVIIPTFNRVEDLKKTIYSFEKVGEKLSEIIIVDQSLDNSTEEFIRSLNLKNLVYVKLSTPSLTKARNLGIKKISIKTRLVCFLDDDVSLGAGYFEGILSVFNTYHYAEGVSGWYLPALHLNRYEQLVKRLFFIEHYQDNCANVVSAYGQVYPSKLDKILSSEWIPGFNMVFKREVLGELSFDEALEKYALGEDFDFSYRVHKKYPGSLFITPFASIEHRASIVERYPTEKAAYMNQRNHFYLNFKNFNKTFIEKITFIWAIIGILLLRTFKAISSRKKIDLIKAFLFYKSLFVCLKQLHAIRSASNTTWLQ
jgi:GT2 family glycosyltransferase